MFILEYVYVLSLIFGPVLLNNRGKIKSYLHANTCKGAAKMQNIISFITLVKFDVKSGII